jgi:hypothetical protein
MGQVLWEEIVSRYENKQPGMAVHMKRLSLVKDVSYALEDSIRTTT